jgi:glycosyltransferase involved in cell wall biosynthesis
MKQVVLCIPTVKKPYQQTLDAIAASEPVLLAAGWDSSMVSCVGCPYIDAARARMLRQALDAKADAIVFIDHDLSWDPQDLLTLLETEGDYVVGTYRFKKEPEEYMGQLLAGIGGRPIVREDGALATYTAPAGFMKITPHAVNRIIEHYPELCYGERHTPHVDFFNYGAYKHTFWGEDYAACRRFIDAGGHIWTVPNLNLTHHTPDMAYPGNLHRFLMRQPGGSEDPAREFHPELLSVA